MTDKPHRKNIVIVIPVFNDWEAFQQLISDLGEQTGLATYGLYVLAVDDGSSEFADTGSLLARKGMLSDIRVIRLACNLGHQRAIAIGLVEAIKSNHIDAVVVMDFDGEDQPVSIGKLVDIWEKCPDQVVVATRGRRSESIFFRLFYSVYKLTFRMTTGQTINFGNFSLLPRSALQALVHNPAIWNNLAAAIARSHIPYRTLQIDRGVRLAGKSRMNFVGLAVHGVSAMSVYTDIVLVRLMVAAWILAGMVLLGVITVVAIRIGTDWAIPGWASYVAASLTIIFIQAVLLAGIALFQLLSVRTLRPFIPASDASAFIVQRSSTRGRKTLNRKG